MLEYSFVICAGLIISAFSLSMFGLFVQDATSIQMKAEMASYVNAMYSSLNTGYWVIKTDRAGEVLSCKNGIFTLSYDSLSISTKIPFPCMFEVKEGDNPYLRFYYDGSYVRAEAG